MIYDINQFVFVYDDPPTETLTNSSGVLDGKFGDALDFRYNTVLGKYFLTVGVSGLNGLTSVNEGTAYLFEQNERVQ